MTETYYDVLGVATDASVDDIEAAYRRKLKETHPDHSDDEDAAEATKLLIRAREVLTDEDERRRYDEVGHAAYVGDEGTEPEEDVGSAARAARRAGWGDPDSGSPGRDGSETRATGTRADAYGRRRRERAARERVSRDRAADGRSKGSTAERRSNGGRTGERTRDGRATGASNTGETAGSRDTEKTDPAGHDGPGHDGPSEARAGTDRTSGGGRRRRPRDASAGGGGHATATGVGPFGASAPSWSSETGYSVRRGYDDASDDRRFVPSVESVSMLGMAFVLYPVLVFSALFPAFPLAVNLVVGACTLCLVGYLQSMPAVGVTVFGTWGLIAPVALLVAGLGPMHPLLLVAVGTTWLPLGLSTLTLVLVRP